jgi:hypothetical protein
VVSGEVNSGSHIGNAGTARDQSRATIDRGIPDPSMVVVVPIVRADQRSAERRREVIDPAAVELNVRRNQRPCVTATFTLSFAIAIAIANGNWLLR